MQCVADRMRETAAKLMVPSWHFCSTALGSGSFLSGALTALPISFVLVLQRCGVGEMLEVRIYGVHLLA